jgi:Domain of unknown function (DUF6456)
LHLLSFSKTILGKLTQKLHNLLTNKDLLMSNQQAYAMNKRMLSVVEIDGEEVIVNLKESPLRWLATRKDVNGQAYLEPHEVMAGERFRHDFTMAGLSPRLGVNWDNPLAGMRSPEHFSDMRVAAKQRLEQTYKNLGPELTNLMIDFCGFLLGIEECEAKRKWPARSGKIVIKLALSQLARHYGLKKEMRGAPKR